MTPVLTSYLLFRHKMSKESLGLRIFFTTSKILVRQYSVYCDETDYSVWKFVVIRSVIFLLDFTTTPQFKSWNVSTYVTKKSFLAKFVGKKPPFKTGKMCHVCSPLQVRNSPINMALWIIAWQWCCGPQAVITLKMCLQYASADTINNDELLSIKIQSVHYSLALCADAHIDLLFIFIFIDLHIWATMKLLCFAFYSFTFYFDKWKNEEACSWTSAKVIIATSGYNDQFRSLVNLDF